MTQQLAFWKAYPGGCLVEFRGRKPVRKEVQEKDDVSGTGSGVGFRVRIGRGSS